MCIVITILSYINTKHNLIKQFQTNKTRSWKEIQKKSSGTNQVTNSVSEQVV